MNLHRFVIGIFFLACSFYSQAQETYKNNAKKLEAAQEAFYEGYYTKAYHLYTELQKDLPEDSNYFKFERAVCLINMDHEERKSLSLLLESKQEFSESDYKAAYFYYLGESFHLNEQFDSATHYLNKSLESGHLEKTQIDRINQKLAQVDYAKGAYANGKNYEVFDVQDEVNGKYKDYSPLISTDESILIFTSKRPGINTELDEDGEHFEDIYISRRNALGFWENPVSISDNINTKDHEASVGISPDGNQIIIYKGNEQSGAFYTSSLDGSDWSKPELLDDGKTINQKKYWETSATMSLDKKTIYFTSDRKGGKGGLDIYYSTRADEQSSWTEPKNLSTQVNTQYDEESPFIHPDGKTLFYSSQGGENMGGFDVFKTVLQDDGSWSAPVNLGYPINTVHNEVHFTLTANGRKAYFSSSRLNTKGEEDIYKVILDEDVEPLVLIKGLVKANDQPLNNVEIKIIDKRTGKSVGIIHKPNPASGKYMIIMPPGNNYTMIVSGEGFDSYQVDLNVPNQEEFHEVYQEIDLKKSESDSLLYEEITVYNSFDDLRDKSFTPELEHPNTTYVNELIHDIMENKDNPEVLQKKINQIDVITNQVTNDFNRVIEEEAHTEEIHVSSLDTLEQIVVNNDTINVVPSSFSTPIPKGRDLFADKSSDFDGDGISDFSEMNGSKKSDMYDPCDPDPNCAACMRVIAFNDTNSYGDVEQALIKKSNEQTLYSNLSSDDTDKDGIADYFEINGSEKSNLLNPCSPDASSKACIQYKNDLASNNASDFDKDGITDYDELNSTTKSDPSDPCDPNVNSRACKIYKDALAKTDYTSDFDQDMFPNYFELNGSQKSNELDPCDPDPNCKACIDSKKDLVVETIKEEVKTDEVPKEIEVIEEPTIKKSNEQTIDFKLFDIDTDQDGIADYFEINGMQKTNSTNPCLPNEYSKACLEYRANTKSLTADSNFDFDGDGLSDYKEINAQKPSSEFDPCDPFTDCDACIEYKKGVNQTDFVSDFDQDRFPNYFELYGAVKSDENDPCDPNPNCEACKKTKPAPVALKELIVYFDFAKYDVKSTYFEQLKAIAQSTKQDNQIIIELEGHTDAIGGQTFNIALSKKRANAVLTKLVSYGLDRQKASIKFFGEEKPVASNTMPDGSDNEQGRQLNRRVTVKSVRK